LREKGTRESVCFAFAFASLSFRLPPHHHHRHRQLPCPVRPRFSILDSPQPNAPKCAPPTLFLHAFPQSQNNIRTDPGNPFLSDSLTFALISLFYFIFVFIFIFLGFPFSLFIFSRLVLFSFQSALFILLSSVSLCVGACLPCTAVLHFCCAVPHPTIYAKLHFALLVSCPCLPCVPLPIGSCVVVCSTTPRYTRYFRLHAQSNMHSARKTRNASICHILLFFQLYQQPFLFGRGRRFN
jgi:hypothetical protein